MRPAYSYCTILTNAAHLFQPYHDSFFTVSQPPPRSRPQTGGNFLDADPIFAPSFPRLDEIHLDGERFEQTEECGHPQHPALLILSRRIKGDTNGLPDPEALCVSASPSSPLPPIEDEEPSSSPLTKSPSSPSPEPHKSLHCLHCSVSTLHIHISFLAALFACWSRCGGPWRTETALLQKEKATAAMYISCSRAYHRVKADMMNCVVEFPEWAITRQI